MDGKSKIQTKVRVLRGSQNDIAAGALLEHLAGQMLARGDTGGCIVQRARFCFGQRQCGQAQKHVSRSHCVFRCGVVIRISSQNDRKFNPASFRASGRWCRFRADRARSSVAARAGCACPRPIVTPVKPWGWSRAEKWRLPSSGNYRPASDGQQGRYGGLLIGHTGHRRFNKELTVLPI